MGRTVILKKPPVPRILLMKTPGTQPQRNRYPHPPCGQRAWPDHRRRLRQRKTVLPCIGSRPMRLTIGEGKRDRSRHLDFEGIVAMS